MMVDCLLNHALHDMAIATRGCMHMCSYELAIYRHDNSVSYSTNANIYNLHGSVETNCVVSPAAGLFGILGTMDVLV